MQQEHYPFDPSFLRSCQCSLRMKFRRPQISLELTLSSSSSSGGNHDMDDDDDTWKWGQTTYRKEDFSIGRDYLRLQGRTISRGLLSPGRLDVQHDSIIGKGNFSTVRCAQWRRRETTQSTNTDKGQETTTLVAVKELSLTQTSKKRHAMLLKELRTLCLMESDFLVKLHGAFLQDDTIFMILEMMNRGSLYDYLQNTGCHGSTTPAVAEDFLACMSWQVLQGLSHLHTHEMIHRDLKPANILLHSDGHVKLCDFGLTTWSDHSLHTTVVGTTKFMAPERLHGLPYGRSSDLWSLGLVLWQCITGQEPWHDVHSMVDLVVTVDETDVLQDWIPVVRGRIHSALLDILVACLQHAPAKRIPAALLLESPWFGEVHSLVSTMDAWQRLQVLLLLDTKHKKEE